MPETNSTNDISLDNVLNTGENNDSIKKPDEQKTPEQIAEETAAAVKKETDDNSNLTIEEQTVIVEENETKAKTMLSSFADDFKLDDDNKTIRQDLLTKYKGTNFDAEGNIIDAEGKVLTSAADIINYMSEEDALTLDDKGNQIDTEGNVIKTNVELSIENTVVNKLHSESGYEFQDENGSTKIYSDDDQGFKDLTDDISAQRFNEFKSEFFNKNPELREISKHILGGGTVDTYRQPVDYSKVDVTKLSKEDKLKHIKTSLTVTGMEKERINNFIQMIEDSNNIDTEADRAVKSLKDYETKVLSDRDAAYQQSVENEQKEVEEYWENIGTTVTKGQLGDVTIPDTEKTAFFDYLSASVDDKGNSKEMLDRDKETVEQQLQFAYLRFKGYDLSSLVKSKATQTRVKSLKQRMKLSAKLKDTPINDAKNSKTSGGKDITIGDLLG